MTIARGNSASTANSSATTSHVVNKPASVAAGDVVVIGVAFNGTPGTLTWPTGFTAFGPNTGQSNPKVYAAYKKLDGSEGSTFTVTSVNSVTSGIGAVAYTGVDASTQMDATPVISDGAAATSANVTGITTVTANTMLVVTIGINSGSTTITENDAKVTEIVDIGGKKCEMDDGLISGTGATGTIAYNFGASRAWGAVVMALRPSTGLSATVNQNSETDTAQAVGKLKQKAVGQNSETDTAQTVTRLKRLTLGLNSETDTAQAISHRKIITVQQVSETDTAQAISKGQTVVAVGQISETDTAQTVSVKKAVTAGQPTETDAAQVIGRFKQKAVGQSSETETAQSITVRKFKVLAQISETDTAQVISLRGNTPVGQSNETDTAQTIGRLKQKAIGANLETDEVQAITARKVLTIGQVGEADEAQAIARGGVMVVIVNQVLELDAAQMIGLVLRAYIGRRVQLYIKERRRIVKRGQ